MRYETSLKQRALIFGIKVFQCIDVLPNKRSCWIISDQLGRSGSSIGANIFEAHGSRTRVEYRRFHEIAFKSANETIYWLIMLKQLKLKENEVEYLLKEADELARILGATIKQLSR